MHFHHLGNVPIAMGRQAAPQLLLRGQQGKLRENRADKGAAVAAQQPVFGQIALDVLEKVVVEGKPRENRGDFRGFAGELAHFSRGQRAGGAALAIRAPRPAPGAAVALRGVGEK